jgi:hypothetical protein
LLVKNSFKMVMKESSGFSHPQMDNSPLLLHPHPLRLQFLSRFPLRGVFLDDNLRCFLTSFRIQREGEKFACNPRGLLGGVL